MKYFLFYENDWVQGLNPLHICADTFQELFFVHLSSYSKAYGRMGLAYSSVEKHKEAVDCFKKAIDIEPANESYRTNLKLAEDRLKSVGSPGLGKL